MSLSFVSVRVQYGSRWIEVNDKLRYSVEGSSFNETSQTYRRTTVESPWIGGRFVTNIVPDTIEETLSVYVYGQDQVDLQDNIDQLIEAFAQFSYIMEFASDQNRLQFSCETADYSIQRSRELRHNNMALVSMRIPRIPEFDRIVDY